MIKNFIISIFILSQGLASEVILNDREGSSFEVSKKERKRLNNFLDKQDADSFKAEFEEILFSSLKEDNYCSVDLVRPLKERFNLKGQYPLLAARELGIIDDITLQLLETVYDFEIEDVSARSNKDVRKIQNFDNVSELKASFERYAYERPGSESCIVEKWQSLEKSIRKFKTKRISYTDLFKWAYTENVISKEQFNELYAIEKTEVHELNYNLKSYIDKKNFLRIQYPVESESADYITRKSPADKHKSNRQRLYESYSQYQIILMGKLVEKLRNRFEANEIHIDILYEDEELEDETIMLSPMEQYRFALKLLRREMDELRQNSFFGGRAPMYSDVITAAYEIGMIPQEELEHIVELEQIWNPKQTRKEKIMYWLKTLGTTALAVTLPPALGGLGVVGILFIEAEYMDPKRNPDPDFSLF